MSSKIVATIAIAVALFGLAVSWKAAARAEFYNAQCIKLLEENARLKTLLGD